MPDNCDIQNKAFEPNSNTYKAKYEARESLHAGYQVWRTYFRTPLGDVRIKPNTDVEFAAGETVVLKPGFYAKEGSTFRAYIDAMPDKCYVFNNTPILNNKWATGENTQEEPQLENRTEEITIEPSIWPNPTNGSLNISTLEASQLAIIDFTGKIVLTTSLQQGENQIDINTLNKGIYIARITTLNGNSTHHKIIKQ